MEEVPTFFRAIDGALARCMWKHADGTVRARQALRDSCALLRCRTELSDLERMVPRAPSSTRQIHRMCPGFCFFLGKLVLVLTNGQGHFGTPQKQKKYWPVLSDV